jgi:hypothetical protein
MSRTWTNQEDDEMCAMRDRGMTWREIGVALGRPMHGVIQRARKIGTDRSDEIDPHANDLMAAATQRFVDDGMAVLSGRI